MILTIMWALVFQQSADKFDSFMFNFSYLGEYGEALLVFLRENLVQKGCDSPISKKMTHGKARNQIQFCL